MKKITALILIIVMAFAVAGCAVSAPENSTSGSLLDHEDKPLIRIATLKGPTGMGMVKLFRDNENEDTVNRYETQIVGAPDEIVGKVISGEIDIAAVPTNLAATLYNKTEGGVQLLAINTLGVLYILEKGDAVSSVEDLNGKILYASGKGATPEFILNYILSGAEADPQVEYKTEHSELITLASAGMADLVMLPEPFVTTLLSKDMGYEIKIDLTKEWEKMANGESVLAMGCLIVRTGFVQENPQAVKDFLVEYEDSVDFLSTDINSGARLIADYGIMPSAELAKAAIPGSNIVCIHGSEMKEKIKAIYYVFYEADPKSVGGKLPSEDFYYED